MKAVLNLFKYLALILIIPTLAFAVDPLPAQLIGLDSEQGMAMLKKDASQQTIKLLSHFTTQSTNTYCGVASSVMVLNSSYLVPPEDSAHKPYTYFNQEDFFNEGVRSVVNPDQVKVNGLTLDQLSDVLRSYGLQSTALHANQLNLNAFRKLLMTALGNNQFIIANFLRTELAQEGSGHYSPIAAYDAQEDRFLVLDVARFKYAAFWVKTEDLWNAVNTKDGESYRGVVISY